MKTTVKLTVIAMLLGLFAGFPVFAQKASGSYEMGNGACDSCVTINLAAKNIAFDTDTITIPAGQQIRIVFDNQDSGVRHNFAAYETSSANNEIFKGKVISGPKKIVYIFTAPQQTGSYYFRCDIHPSLMTGTLDVVSADSYSNSSGS